MKLKFPVLLLALSFLFSAPVYATQNDSSEAYNALTEARGKTHAAGPFRLRGEETSTKESTVNNQKISAAAEYQVSGYDYFSSETYMKLVPLDKNGKPSGNTAESFLITPSTIYTKTGTAKWAAQDIIALLPKFAALGTLDQFFLLELLNGGRLNLYADYISFAPDAEAGGENYKVTEVKLSRAEFLKLAEVITDDVKSLLGAAADGMNEVQLNMIKTFAKGMLQSLDAELSYKFYIDADGKIARVDYTANMANPIGDAGAVSRIKTESSLQLYDFGTGITRIIP